MVQQWAGTRGLARMEAPGGVFIMFSAGARQEALDKLDPNDPVTTSVFVRSVLPLLGRKDLSLIDIAKETQEKVRELARGVGRDQVPAYYDGIVGRVTLTGALAPARPAETASPAKPGPTAGSEDIFWQSIQGSTDPALFRAYLDRVGANAFPGTYKALAELKLAALQPRPEPPASAASPPPSPAVAPARSEPPPVGDSAEMRACDAAAADRRDPDRPADVPGVGLDAIDPRAAIAACGAAVKTGNPPRRAFYELALAYEKVGNGAGAAANRQKAADLGHPLALYDLADRLLAGRGVPKDAPRALSLFYKAADAGYRPAIVRVASMYANGQGAERDYRKAGAFYQLALKQGETAAYADLGLLYLYGRGVPKDPRRACDMFRQGAAAGSAAAAQSLDAFCRPG